MFWTDNSSPSLVLHQQQSRLFLWMTVVKCLCDALAPFPLIIVSVNARAASVLECRSLDARYETDCCLPIKRRGRRSTTHNILIKYEVLKTLSLKHFRQTSRRRDGFENTWHCMKSHQVCHHLLMLFQVFLLFWWPKLHLFDQKNAVKIWNIFTIKNNGFLCECLLNCNLFLWSKLYFQHHFSSLQCHMIFRNHSNMLICCSRNISDCYQWWNLLCCPIFLWKPWSI